MLIRADKSVLLIVDVQDKLATLIHEPRRLVENCVWLVKAAQRLGIPVVASEQYPQGLGSTVLELKELIPQDMVGAKVHFSCSAAGCLDHLPELGREQIIICGIEAHVCVLQSALDYLRTGSKVFVVSDAISSRDPMECELAQERMRQHGIQIVSKEMVLFEWLRLAGSPLFKEISAEFLRS